MTSKAEKKETITNSPYTVRLPHAKKLTEIAHGATGCNISSIWFNHYSTASEVQPSYYNKYS